MNLIHVPVRTRPHRTIPASDIIISDRVRGVVAETLPELVESIAELGLLYPVLIDDSNRLVDGEQRIAALAQLGVTDIPVIVDATPTDAASEDEVIAERLRRELASNGVRTAYTPVQAAAARRRLRELSGRTQHRRRGATLAERRKGWASELATAETGISRTTMDRVDQIVRIAEDVSRPMSVRREAAEGLSRIDNDGVAVDRVLKEVSLAAAAAKAVERYPALRALPTPDAQVALAGQLDGLPEQARDAQLQAMSALWSHSTGDVEAFRTLSDTSRIDDLFQHGEAAVSAVHTLGSNGHLTQELHESWGAVAERFETLARELREALSGKARP